METHSVGCGNHLVNIADVVHFHFLHSTETIKLQVSGAVRINRYQYMSIERQKVLTTSNFNIQSDPCASKLVICNFRS